MDFHAGSVTREHDDLDLAAWVEDADRVATLLRADDWVHAPDPQEDGYTVYERGELRLELAFIARGEDGHVYTPLRSGSADWPDGAFQDDLLELRGVRARVIALGALEADKSAAHDDPAVAAKDRADLATLSRVARRRG